MPVVGVTMDACVQPPLSAHAEGRSLSVGHASCGDDDEDAQHHGYRADSSYPPNHTHTDARRRGRRRFHIHIYGLGCDLDGANQQR